MLRAILNIGFVFILCISGSVNGFAQKACCTKGSAKSTCAKNTKAADMSTNAKAVACCTKSTAQETTSGCTPSNCRGAKTKFGEAKVISDLRLKLVALKANMETYENKTFSERSYSVHDIIGESDDQSLEIIEQEVQLIEEEFIASFDLELNQKSKANNKAKQVRHLTNRIDFLQSVL